jgi:hypothetical protein
VFLPHILLGLCFREKGQAPAFLDPFILAELASESLGDSYIVML